MCRLISSEAAQAIHFLLVCKDTWVGSPEAGSLCVTAIPKIYLLCVGQSCTLTLWQTRKARPCTLTLWQTRKARPWICNAMLRITMLHITFERARVFLLCVMIPTLYFLNLASSRCSLGLQFWDVPSGSYLWCHSNAPDRATCRKRHWCALIL